MSISLLIINEYFRMTVWAGGWDFEMIAKVKGLEEAFKKEIENNVDGYV
jgi:hypothetical protein